LDRAEPLQVAERGRGCALVPLFIRRWDGAA